MGYMDVEKSILEMSLTIIQPEEVEKTLQSGEMLNIKL